MCFKCQHINCLRTIGFFFSVLLRWPLDSNPAPTTLTGTPDNVVFPTIRDAQMLSGILSNLSRLGLPDKVPDLNRVARCHCWEYGWKWLSGGYLIQAAISIRGCLGEMLVSRLQTLLTPCGTQGRICAWQRAQALSFLLLLLTLADAPHPLWHAGAHLCMVVWSVKNLHDCMACELKELEL